nr:thioesterase family protein [Solirubrobacterales bacterium]
TLSAADKPVMVARAWRLAPVDLELPRSAPTTTAGPGLTLDERARVPAPPEQGESQAFFETGHEVGYDTSMEFEFIEGGFGEPGPARVWTRMPRQVLAEKPVSPLQRVMVAVDSGSGISAMLDWRRYLFINVDLTVHLVREPVGEWICLDSVTLAGDDGIGLTDTAILDEHGPIGRGSQSLLVGKRPSA